MACYLKEVQNFSYNLPHDIKLLKDHIIDLEYPQGICSPNCVAEDVSRLFAYSFLLLKIQGQHK